MLKNILRVKNASTLLRQLNPLLTNLKYTTKSTTNQSRNFAQDAAVDNENTNEKSEKKILNPFNRASTSNQKIPELTSAPELSDEEREKRLKVLKLEADIAAQEGRRVPTLDFFKDEHWNHILALPSKSARLKYYAFLWMSQVKKAAQKRKKAEKSAEIVQRREEFKLKNADNGHIIYALTHTSMFLRIYDTTINQLYNNRLIKAMQFEPKIVMDCSYDQHMTTREALNAAKQLMLTFAANRNHDQPFDLHYCNVDMNSVCMQSLKRYIPTMLNMEFPMNVHEKCFTELFPKENLVYLTPHCRTDLLIYNPDDIYIIGAMVDTANNEPISLAKAKKLGLRMARLPLDHYLQWSPGSGKSLTLNQMISVMLDQKCTKDWNISLKHVPRRKVIDFENNEDFQRAKLKKRAEKLNVNFRSIFDDKSHKNRVTVNSNKFRTHRDNMQFNLETWGDKKKRNNS